MGAVVVGGWAVQVDPFNCHLSQAGQGSLRKGQRGEEGQRHADKCKGCRSVHAAATAGHAESEAQAVRSERTMNWVWSPKILYHLH